MPEAAPSRYVMGHDDRERRRLVLQASIINPFTERLMRRAGIAAGMRVLDIGCGVGEVSFIVSRLVGRHGRVTAIDIDEVALIAAQERARDQSLANIEFLQKNVHDYRPNEQFDAVVGRHILLHTRDPLMVIQNAWHLLHIRGIAVFHEYDFSVLHAAYPTWPLRERLTRVFRDFFCSMVQGDVGTRLFHLFIQAGFTAPDCRVEYPIDGGSDSPFYEWMAESLRSILPRAQPMGLIQDLDFDIDTLAQRLREEAVSLNACCPAPLMVGACARKGALSESAVQAS